MFRPELPDPPDKFLSYKAWIQLSNSAMSGWQALWIGRDRVLSNLDGAIEFHEREHAQLAAAYEEERQRYRKAHAAFAIVSAGSNAERDSVAVAYRHLQAAVCVYDKLIDRRLKVERKFEVWMDLHGFAGKPKGRDANRKLSQRRLLLRQERENAFNDRLTLGRMLVNIRKRLEECDRCLSEQGTPGGAVVARGSDGAFGNIGELNEYLARFASASDSVVVTDCRQVER
ncbi:hypothetical protein [Povalibacter sp.]|uniref:hypothetical protein n=1 Tax=Povalibacter sp. TaxID=1962978 RepID=UPI002F408912